MCCKLNNNTHQRQAAERRFIFHRTPAYFCTRVSQRETQWGHNTSMFKKRSNGMHCSLFCSDTSSIMTIFNFRSFGHQLRIPGKQTKHSFHRHINTAKLHAFALPLRCHFWVISVRKQHSLCWFCGIWRTSIVPDKALWVRSVRSSPPYNKWRFGTSYWYERNNCWADLNNSHLGCDNRIHTWPRALRMHAAHTRAQCTTLCFDMFMKSSL